MIPPFEKGMTTAYKKLGNDEYFGWADRGAATSSSRWKIMKIEYTNVNWITKYPDGDDRFRFVWDSYNTYTYQILKQLNELT